MTNFQEADRPIGAEELNLPLMRRAALADLIDRTESAMKPPVADERLVSEVVEKIGEDNKYFGKLAVTGAVAGRKDCTYAAVHKFSPIGFDLLTS